MNRIATLVLLALLGYHSLWANRSSYQRGETYDPNTTCPYILTWYLCGYGTTIEVVEPCYRDVTRRLQIAYLWMGTRRVPFLAQTCPQEYDDPYSLKTLPALFGNTEKVLEYRQLADGNWIWSLTFHDTTGVALFRIGRDQDEKLYAEYLNTTISLPGELQNTVRRDNDGGWYSPVDTVWLLNKAERGE